MASNIRRVAGTVMLAFAVVAIALGYWQFIAADSLLERTDNPRRLEAEARIPRGRILDRTGTQLAWSERRGEVMVRRYLSASVAHVTGFHSLRLGTTGIEQRYDSFLRGEQGSTVQRLRARLLGEQQVGSDVTITIDARLQQVAAEVLGDAPGAVVALDPKTGAVLAMASQPTFDAGAIDTIWDRLSQDASAPLVNRATQATYPPGSTFKLITAAAALDLGLVEPDAPFNCTTGVQIDGLAVDCRNHSHLARVNFQEAFAWSCNRTFAITGLLLGFAGPITSQLDDRPPSPRPWQSSGIGTSAGQLSHYAERFGFDREIPFELPVATSHLKGSGDWYPSLLAQTAFGQGELAATPLLMALSAATVANGGVMPTPYLGESVRDPVGSAASLRPAPGITRPAIPQSVIKPESAARLNEFMKASVDHAYAQRARIAGVAVAGKTGSAEAGPGRQTHSWFIGYAPADAPRIAVAVIMENRGSGSDFATPAAQRVMETALRLSGPERAV